MTAMVIWQLGHGEPPALKYGGDGGLDSAACTDALVEKAKGPRACAVPLERNVRLLTKNH